MTIKHFNVVFRGFTIAILALFAFIAAPASATPILWTFDNALLNNATAVTGSFVFDADTLSYSSIVTSAGTKTFDFTNSVNASSAKFLLTSDGPDFSGDATLLLSFLAPLTNAGGNVGLALNSFSAVFAGCFNADCGIVTSGADFQFASGSVIGQSVPEPGALSLLGLGLVELVFIKRRRRVAA